MARKKSTQESVVKSRKSRKVRWEIWHNYERKRFEIRLWDAQSEGAEINYFAYDSYGTTEELAYEQASAAMNIHRKYFDDHYDD